MGGFSFLLDFGGKCCVFFLLFFESIVKPNSNNQAFFKPAQAFKLALAALDEHRVCRCVDDFLFRTGKIFFKFFSLLIELFREQLVRIGIEELS